jgi:hypothetical protein
MFTKTYIRYIPILCVSVHLDACVLCVGGRWLGAGAV